jgi:hypothetical protein
MENARSFGEGEGSLAPSLGEPLAGVTEGVILGDTDITVTGVSAEEIRAMERER